MRLDAGANVGHADQNVPCAGWDGAGQAGRRGIGEADGEHGFVAAAPAAQTGGIEHAEIERGVLFLAGVGRR